MHSDGIVVRGSGAGFVGWTSGVMTDPIHNSYSGSAIICKMHGRMRTDDSASYGSWSPASLIRSQRACAAMITSHHVRNRFSSHALKRCHSISFGLCCCCCCRGGGGERCQMRSFARCGTSPVMTFRIAPQLKRRREIEGGSWRCHDKLMKNTSRLSFSVWVSI